MLIIMTTNSIVIAALIIAHMLWRARANSKFEKQRKAIAAFELRLEELEKGASFTFPKTSGVRTFASYRERNCFHVSVKTAVFELLKQLGVKYQYTSEIESKITREVIKPKRAIRKK